MVSVNHIAHRLLSEAHSPTSTSSIFAEKVIHKRLRLRPTSPETTSQDARAQRRRQRLHKKEKTKRRQNPKPLSAKEKRISGIYDIPDDTKKYEIYVPLHKMWGEYMREVLGMGEDEKRSLTAQSAGSKLASADYHGAELTVARSRSVGMVGLAGIVVRDTKFTFQIITKKDKLKTIPKKHTIFRFEIPQNELDEADGKEMVNSSGTKEFSKRISPIFELHGSQFENRATDRATKKFKQRNMSDL